MNIEKNEVYGILKRVTETIRPKPLCCVCFCLLSVCLGLDIGFDRCDRLYCNTCLKRIFSYDQGILIAIIVLMWTFTVSFSIYCMEHSGERYYGIRRVNILLVDLRGGLVCLIIMIFMELLALIVSSVLEWKITLLMVTFQQLFITIYLLLILAVKTSYRNTLLQIRKDMESILDRNLSGLARQIQGVDRVEDIRQEKNYPMLFKMVRGIDYADDYGRDELLHIIREIAKWLKQRLEECGNDKIKQYQMQKDINLVSYQIASDALRTETRREIIMDFMNNLMSCAATLAFKQGIMMALLEDLIPQHIYIFQRLLQIESEHHRELQIWCAVYNVFMQQFEGEQWRKAYVQFQFNELHTDDWKDADVRMALDMWDQVRELRDTSDVKSLGQSIVLFKYIFFDD